MFEWLRRLTANYTEEEYRNWVFSYLDDAGIPRGQNDYTIPDIGENAHNKDIACLLADVADNTGYEPEFLYEMFDEQTNDYLELGEPLGKAHKLAFEHTAAVSYEQDW